ncbi:MAG: ribosome assembly RNA-binding protein YhbY [Deltaproteobacteria bacterium]|nr:ribosome assembly RNA-binding protein YhbY [Deltaproteobacteria bacterium]
MELSGKQKRHLRALGNTLNPVVRLGKAGLGDALVTAVDSALTRHELVKIKLSPETPESRDEVADFLSEHTKSAIAQVMGGTILLYRRHPEEPKIVLPARSDGTH